MKKIILSLLMISILVFSVGVVVAKKDECVTLKEGTLMYSAGHYLAGQPLIIGYDPFGYNYQAMMFNGYYSNAYLGRDGFPPYMGDDEAYLAENPKAENHWTWPYRDIKLMMKWNDAWLSNKDCDDDGSLDRHFGLGNYIGSDAWLTNHMSGGEKKDKWTYFMKIVDKPTPNYECESIWDQFCIIQEVNSGEGVIFYRENPGLGNW